ncbi:MAG TPA: MBL fold metallo-hydrolase [Kofleriaceae bacterium]
MRATSIVAVLGVVVGASVAQAQPAKDYSKVQIKTTRVAEGVYLLEGDGGNIGLSVGDDGVVVIDDEFAPLSEKIQAAIKAITPKPVRFILNTHWHGDHTGGNENFANAGAVIIAHENVRKRMSSEQFIGLLNKKVPASPARALPVVTFESDITLHLNGEDIQVIHVGPAHTDGDSIVVFPKAKVAHLGDCYMTISYPFADGDSGGTFDGFISVADKVLGMTDDGYKLIPGHGALSTKADYKGWHDMLVGVRAKVKKLADAGKPLDAIQKAKPTAEWDARWGTSFIKPDMIVESAYKAIKAPKPAAKPAK